MQICKFRGSSRLSPVLLWPPLFSFALLLVRLRPAHLAEAIQPLAHCSKPVGLTPLKNGWPCAPLNTFRPLAHLAEAGSSRRKAGKYTHYFPTNQSETTSFVVFRFASRKKYRIPPKMMSNFSSRPTYREVTACGGTFPDTATYLLRVRHPYHSLFEVVPASEQRLFHPHALPVALVLYYQLAFFTPGISPFEAISRNWIRLMPN